MTRDEFFDEVVDWGDLINFCNEHDLSNCEDVYDENMYDEFIDECLADWARDEHWYDLRDILSNLPNGYDYYMHTDDGWEGLTDYDFDRMLHDVADSAEEYGVFDEEDEEDEEDDEPEETDPEGEPIPEEECSISDMIEDGVSCIRQITAEVEHAKEDGWDFLQFPIHDSSLLPF